MMSMNWVSSTQPPVVGEGFRFDPYGGRDRSSSEVGKDQGESQGKGRFHMDEHAALKSGKDRTGVETTPHRHEGIVPRFPNSTAILDETKPRAKHFLQNRPAPVTFFWGTPPGPRVVSFTARSLGDQRHGLLSFLPCLRPRDLQMPPGFLRHKTGRQTQPVGERQPSATQSTLSAVAQLSAVRLSAASTLTVTV